MSKISEAFELIKNDPAPFCIHTLVLKTGAIDTRAAAMITYMKQKSIIEKVGFQVCSQTDAPHSHYKVIVAEMPARKQHEPRLPKETAALASPTGIVRIKFCPHCGGNLQHFQ